MQPKPVTASPSSLKNLQIWNSKHGEDRYKLALRKFEERFLDWAAHLGVFAEANRSLDQRLEPHPRYRDHTLMWLDMLKRNLLYGKIAARMSMGLQAD